MLFDRERMQLCTFFQSDLFLAIETAKVKEVLREQEITRVPLAPPLISGLLNLRGQIITAIDLSYRLGLGKRPGHAHGINLVVRTRNGLASLLVDRIGDVLEITDHALEKPPETLRGPMRELVLGVVRLDRHLLLVLDSEATAHVGELEKA